MSVTGMLLRFCCGLLHLRKETGWIIRTEAQIYHRNKCFSHQIEFLLQEKVLPALFTPCQIIDFYSAVPFKENEALNFSSEDVEHFCLPETELDVNLYTETENTWKKVKKMYNSGETLEIIKIKSLKYAYNIVNFDFSSKRSKLCFTL